ncbi:hypothetical protein INT45_001106, partial [Circinella minor]
EQNVAASTSAGSSAQSSGDLSNNVAITHPSSKLDEIDHAHFCDANHQKFNADQEHPYTVGPPELVVAFFSEFVVKRKFNKNVPIGTDVRTQIYVKTNEESNLTTTLPQLTDAARLSKDVSWPSPIDNQNLALLLKHHRNNLVYDQVVTNAQSPSLPYT